MCENTNNFLWKKQYKDVEYKNLFIAALYELMLVLHKDVLFDWNLSFIFAITYKISKMAHSDRV
jgi:hypothetical protein